MILEQVRGLAEKETAVSCFILLFVSFSEPFIHRSRPIQRQPLWNIGSVGSGESQLSLVGEENNPAMKNSKIFHAGGIG